MNLSREEIEAKIKQYEVQRDEYVRNLSSLSPGLLRKIQEDIYTLHNLLSWHAQADILVGCQQLQNEIRVSPGGGH